MATAKDQQEHMARILTETLTLLCKTGLQYKTNFSIKALIGITLDDDDIILVDIKETVRDPNISSNGTSSPRIRSNLPTLIQEGNDSSADDGRLSPKSREKKRKRKGSNPVRISDSTAAKQSKGDGFVPRVFSDHGDDAENDVDTTNYDDNIDLTYDSNEQGQDDMVDLIMVKEESCSPHLQQPLTKYHQSQAMFNEAVESETLGEIRGWTPNSNTVKGSSYALDNWENSEDDISQYASTSSTSSTPLQNSQKQRRLSDILNNRLLRNASKSPSGANARINSEYRKYTKEDYRKALIAIQNGEMSVVEATKLYGIPPTTLRTALKKLGTDKNLLRRQANSSKSLSEEELQSLEKERDTVSQEKISKAVRAVIINRQGMGRAAAANGISIDLLRKEVIAQRGEYEELYNRAVEAVQSGGKSVVEAAELFSVPKGELLRRVTKAELNLSLSSDVDMPL